MRMFVRSGVFETSSSSVNAVCIITPEQFDRFNDGERNLLVTGVVSEDVRDALGLSVGDSVSYRRLVDLNASSGDPLGFGGDRYAEEDYADPGDYLENDPYEFCDRMRDLLYRGFWSRLGVFVSEYSMETKRCRTPGGEDVILVGYSGHT